MYKYTATYTDYNGAERTEDFYFNLSKAELAEMELSVNGGMKQLLEKIVQTQDNEKLVKYFKEMLLKSYGVKSLDGRRFVKNQEVLDDFVQTEAYSDLFMKLASDAEFATKFVNGIMPKDVAEAQNKPNLKVV